MHDAEMALDARRPHPRRARRLPARHRRLRSLRADHADQQPVHAARALRRPELRQRVHARSSPTRRSSRRSAAPAGSTACSSCERLLDLAARELGIDRVEIRRRNFLPPDDFPHDHEIIFQDFAPLVYDSGNYLPALEQAAEHDRLRAVRARGAAAAARRGPPRRHRHRLLRRGHRHRPVRRRARHGRAERQGARRHRRRHAGAGALHRVRADRRRAAGRRRRRRARWSPATRASSTGAPARSPAAARWWPATRATRRRSTVREKVLDARRRAARSAPRTSSSSPAAACACAATPAPSDRARRAGRAAPTRCAARSRPGTEPGLEATAYFGPDRGSTASGVHAMIVEVDPRDRDGRGSSATSSSTTAARCINPLLVEGQIHGGVAHGIGNAFYEQLRLRRAGPAAERVVHGLPAADRDRRARIEIAHVETPSPFNPLGVKGVGEAGCIPDGRAVRAGGRGRARRSTRLEILRDPALSPNRLFEIVSATGPGGRGRARLRCGHEARRRSATSRRDSLEEALALLAEHGDEAKALAGGQSLVPAMNFRLAQPAVLVDLNRVARAGVHRRRRAGRRRCASAP